MSEEASEDSILHQTRVMSYSLQCILCRDCSRRRSSTTKAYSGTLPITSSSSLRYQLQHYSDIRFSSTDHPTHSLRYQFRFPLNQLNQMNISKFLCWTCRLYLFSLSTCPSSTRRAYSVLLIRSAYQTTATSMRLLRGINTAHAFSALLLLSQARCLSRSLEFYHRSNLFSLSHSFIYSLIGSSQSGGYGHNNTINFVKRLHFHVMPSARR